MFFTFASAELNLVVTASIDDKTTDVFIQTNEEADLGFDVYDLEYPPFPVSSHKFFSLLEGEKELIMDSWKSENRYLQLVYSRDKAEFGALNLEFNGDISPTFKVVLYDFGEDSEYKERVGASLITGDIVYEINSSEKKRYFGLDIDYLYCGDSICSDDEDCSICSVDCSGCEGIGKKDPYYILSAAEAIKGKSFEFDLSEGYKFKLNDEIHSVKMISIVNSVVKVSVASDPFIVELNSGEEKEVDVDMDGVNDIMLKGDILSSDTVNMHFKGLGGGFDDVLEEEEGDDTPRASIFDKNYRKSKPLWLRIVISSVLFIIGIGMLIFSVILLRKVMKAREIKPVVYPQGNMPVQEGAVSSSNNVNVGSTV